VILRNTTGAVDELDRRGNGGYVVAAVPDGPTAATP
jgi:hypothetical protein